MQASVLTEKKPVIKDGGSAMLRVDESSAPAEKHP